MVPVRECGKLGEMYAPTAAQEGEHVTSVISVDGREYVEEEIVNSLDGLPNIDLVQLHHFSRQL